MHSQGPCPRCGQPNFSTRATCDACGARLPGGGYLDLLPSPQLRRDTASPSMLVLAFLFPLLGVIFYCVYWGQKPRAANRFLMTSLLGLLVGLIVLALRLIVL